MDLDDGSFILAVIRRHHREKSPVLIGALGKNFLSELLCPLL